MTGKVLSLVKNDKQDGIKPSDPVVIERLEQALEMAKAGGAANVGLVMIMDDGEVLDCWSSNESAFVMVGALESLKRDFMTSCIEGR